MNTVKTYVIAYYPAGTTDIDIDEPTFRRLSAKTDVGAVRQAKKFLLTLATRPEVVHLLFSDGCGTRGCLNRFGNVTSGTF